MAESAAGNYLAGRHGQSMGDWSSAADYMLAALAGAPESKDILQRAFFLSLAAGRMDDAVPLSEQMIAAEPSAHFALALSFADAVKQEDWPRADARLAAMGNEGLGQFLTPLFAAWLAQAEGRETEALARLESASDTAGFAGLYTLHAGMIAELQGKTEEADRWYQEAAAAGLSLRGSEIVASWYSRTGRQDKALETVTRLRELTDGSHLLDGMQHKLENGEVLAPEFSTPTDGLAEALFDFASALEREGASDVALLYGHIAEHLRPRFDLLHFVMGSLLVDREQLDMAKAQFDQIPRDSELYWAARMRLVDAYEAVEAEDQAIALARELTRLRPHRPDGWEALGDVYRSAEDWEEAVDAYNHALANIDTEEKTDWSLHYKRAICKDQLGDWLGAEADLVAALELDGDQAYVLNYLGYSWADQGKNLQQAKSMVERAVSLRPTDGYIIDSLGWVLYRIGRFDDAALILERAVALVPDDPEINGHLGDAYWQVGRKLEAGFQWRRALQDAESEELREKMADRLAYGLEPPPIYEIDEGESPSAVPMPEIPSLPPPLENRQTEPEAEPGDE
jgi:tetratricopeptide (TPR) repeat protein